VPGPHPPIPEPTGPTGFLISRKAAIWVTAIALFVSAMTWLALYEIKVPEGGGSAQGANLADQVMEALKKRVDPDGVRNLVWRPQGNTRLEIQMPLTRTSLILPPATRQVISEEPASEVLT